MAELCDWSAPKARQWNVILLLCLDNKCCKVSVSVYSAIVFDVRQWRAGLLLRCDLLELKEIGSLQIFATAMVDF
jgi:hypothetical protein